MNEEILKKLERKLDRRSFLRGSGLAAIAVVGIAAAPLMAYAQEQTQDEKKAAEKKAAEDKKAAEEKAAAEKKAGGDTDKNETKLDAEGREYRECPQCGSNMYRQGRTWTCENCGYSYVE
jgi:nucleoid-associated protein YgaU